MALAPQSTSTRRTHPSNAPRVLIVEDELLVAWHLESLAREQNLEVCALVPDGDGAIEQAADLDADLILMDIRLAGRMDGIEAARLSARSATRRSSLSRRTAIRRRAQKSSNCCRECRCWQSRSPRPSSKRRSIR